MENFQQPLLAPTDIIAIITELTALFTVNEIVNNPVVNSILQYLNIFC